MLYLFLVLKVKDLYGLDPLCGASQNYVVLIQKITDDIAAYAVFTSYHTRIEFEIKIYHLIEAVILDFDINFLRDHENSTKTYLPEIGRNVAFFIVIAIKNIKTLRELLNIYYEILRFVDPSFKRVFLTRRWSTCCLANGKNALNQNRLVESQKMRKQVNKVLSTCPR